MQPWQAQERNDRCCQCHSYIHCILLLYHFSHIFTLIFTILQSNGVGQVVDDEGDSAYFGTTSGDVVKVRSLMMVIIVMVKSTITLQSIVDNILLLSKIALNSKSGGAPAIVSASVRSVSPSKHNWDRNPTKIM